MTLNTPTIIQLPKICDPRGNLSFIQNGNNLPFKIARCYWIYDVPGGCDRGGHAYKENQEFIVALSGAFDVVLDDGKFELLLIPNPKTAQDLQNLVLALLNQEYDSQGLVFRHVSSIHLETEEDLPWSLDGEYAASAPAVDITNCQRAMTMLLG